LQDPLAGTGYVQEAYVRALAQEAGFEFVAASDLNANARDSRDHPFGVWTLPPTLRTSPLGQEDDPGFDTAPYEAIGESDRMTLKFRKPGGGGAALPQGGGAPP
jgi:predicted methyltransferase